MTQAIIRQDGLVAENEEQIQEQELQEERAADEVRGPWEPLRRRPAGVDYVVAAEDTTQTSTFRGRHYFPIPSLHDVRPFGPKSTSDFQQNTRVLDGVGSPSLATNCSELFATDDATAGACLVESCPKLWPSNNP